MYGCSGMDIRHVRHVRISRMEELDLLKGSKYVQSDLGLTFKQIRGDLKVGKEVLFVGTPCQVGGLKTYLRKDYDNLITADLVCHGVPSQQLLNDNIDKRILSFFGRKSPAKLNLLRLSMAGSS